MIACALLQTLRVKIFRKIFFETSQHDWFLDALYGCLQLQLYKHNFVSKIDTSPAKRPVGPGNLNTFIMAARCSMGSEKLRDGALAALILVKESFEAVLTSTVNG
jgi:hypothetical protein